jgi:hypothetical protein
MGGWGLRHGGEKEKRWKESGERENNKDGMRAFQKEGGSMSGG